MVRINLQTGEIIKRQEFAGVNPEKQLQTYIEKYLMNFFGCCTLKSFYNIPGGEIDTLAISEDGVPCILEYKHKKDDNIISQIVFYYDWLQQRGGKAEFERIVRENEKTKDLVIDWSDIRLICIAEKFSKWDISLIKNLDINIECYTYTYHKDELDVYLDPIIDQFKTQKGISDGRVVCSDELTLEHHRNKADEKGKELLDNLREKVLELGDDVEEGFTPEYIKYVVNTLFLGVHVRRNWLIIHLRVNEDNFDDPKNITKDISNRNWSTTREIKIVDLRDFDYIVSLIKQAYEYQH